MFFLRFALFVLFLVNGSQLMAEPWLSTRFAQNCSGCHAPGRKNLKPKDRRCSLSCQGCHVNPNGGGMRSFYGKWNSQYWLRTLRIKKSKPTKKKQFFANKYFENKKIFADFPKQKYGKEYLRMMRLAKKKGLNVHVPTKRGEKPKFLGLPKKGQKFPYVYRPSKKKMDRIAAQKGFKLVESKTEIVDEKDYDKYADQFYIITALSREEFEYSIPQTDPYRLMDDRKIDGGGDFRLLSYHPLGDAGESKNFLMEMSFGLRYRPIRNTHLVYESRFFGSPLGYGINEIPESLKLRSLYLMVDDLPYNVFVMGGYYRPLFGRYTPDHTTLGQIMMASATTGSPGNTSKELWYAYSAGTAPNVPYMNVHYISRGFVPDEPQHSGFVINAGLRFVTMGGSLNYSYWNTSDTSDSAAEVRVEMHDLNLAMTKYDVIFEIDAMLLTRDDTSRDFRRGRVITIDTKYRFWRENYATFEFASANTNKDLSPGSSSQFRIGAKSFVVPGVEVSTLYAMDNSTKKPLDGATIETDIDYIQLQLHTYF